MDYRATSQEPHRRFHLSPVVWGLAVSCLFLIWQGFRDGVLVSFRNIWGRPEYSHGLLIPFISIFLVWQRRDLLNRETFSGSWIGVGMVLIALAVNVLGILGSLYVVQQYAVVIAIYGLVLALTGWRVFRLLWAPLLLLLLMVPLPEFLYQNLSAQLQLISSRIGVSVIRLFGISVYLEGNVIDLGVYKLQVADACSGLRYLFPLMTLGFIMAYFFHGALWKRALLFISSIPITVLMNSLRIGGIGVLVEHFGISQAEGFLHDFEGWAIFIAGTAIMVLEVIVMASIGHDRQSWREVFGLEFAQPAPAVTIIVRRPLAMPFLVAVAVLGLGAAAGRFTPNRVPVIFVRDSFVDFPSELAGLTARRQSLESAYLKELRLDDYFLADFSGDGQSPINLYVAWYDTQQAGRSAHSPRSCLPAGGWAFEALDQVVVPGAQIANQALHVNRAVIRLGNTRELMYYFFKQRQRVLTNEYGVKWFLMWDALTQNRTDGALVRLTMPVGSNESLDAADSRLQIFMAAVAPKLAPFLPD